MRKDRRPYWVKKNYLRFRAWYTQHFLKPACDYLGDYPTFMKPWYISISGPNIEIGRCATVIGEPESRVKIGVWGLDEESGRIKIGDYVLISPGTRISAANEIVIGDSVMMANGVYITDSDWHEVYDRSRRSEAVTPVHIADNVWLGDHSTVLKGVTIGENSIVAACAVVTKDVPANVVVAGNPAVVVKKLDSDKPMKTRADYFKNPEELEIFFDGVDKMVLSENRFLNWCRAIIKPNNCD
ncbi:Putative acetyltransferase [Zhongshania aliphaticivorans]|uniref:Acetyltransferase n=1 Tax=Zhongshania aliphaticivorans TaxID=1470434 RepID=A0A5S9N7G7_9GAMM|nr:acyltransferase [Zhongshania aliphaticivorans]CAA0082788.1 Putative acetyltransferase [Zhongshania aliphaticivorans]CAA0084000.1 Putative acetyltransferase [Zhongshania aliphaticivorans]